MEFLSFHTLHQMQAGMIFHQSSSPCLHPTLRQLLRSPKLELGITHFIPKIHKSIHHIFIVVLQCKKRCSLLSTSWSHKTNLEHWRLLLWKLTWVRHAFLITEQTKEDTFCWNFYFPNLLPRPIHLNRASLTEVPVSKFYWKILLLFIFHLSLSGQTDVPPKDSNNCNILINSQLPSHLEL